MSGGGVAVVHGGGASGVSGADAATAQQYNVHPVTGATLLRKTLSGALAVRYGALPMVPLPGDDEPLRGFVIDAADILCGVGIFRRDHMVVVPDRENRRMREMKPEMFCSWSQSFFMTYKVRYDGNDEPYDVVKDMPTDVALKTLASGEFVARVPEIVRVVPVPLPFFRGDGEMDVTPVGHYEPMGAYTYDL